MLVQQLITLENNMNDHRKLYCHFLEDHSKWAVLLSFVVENLTQELSCTDLRAIIRPLGLSQAKDFVKTLDDKEREEWVRCVKEGKWKELISHPKLQAQAGWGSGRAYNLARLEEAYRTPFLGDAATHFIEFLREEEKCVRQRSLLCYAKALSIVQSSGTGKSRLLTETGKQIFTLSICIRHPNSPGYPPTDLAVHRYFSVQVGKHIDLSLTAHAQVACFLAATHTTMLNRLEEKYAEGMRGLELLKYWNDLMERQDDRSSFFGEVMELAESLRASQPHDLNKSKGNIEGAANLIYGKYTLEATKKLVKFLAKVGVDDGKTPVFVTCFDDADELGPLFWVLLRLLSNQDRSTAMWYLFMATKSDVSYVVPIVKSMSSLLLIDEVTHLLPPYITLCFDQNSVVNDQAERCVKVDELQSLQHLCQYGRPLWCALFPQVKDQVIETARLKLTNSDGFNVQSQDHVLAVLSQRLCLEPVLTNPEAIKLANRSAAKHMRLLTGMPSDRRIFYTYSPSEPVLALAAADLILETQGWGPIIETLSNDLCGSWLVEKGLTGELAARTLLLVARDFTVPKEPYGLGLLKPVLLMNFLDQLFGGGKWCVKENRVAFEGAFHSSYVNFTHWIVTKDPRPQEPDQQLLANLYARGGGLQCSVNQESPDLLIPMYDGPVTPGSIYDPTKLSAVVIQVKYKIAGDIEAGDTLRPIGIPRDLHNPLPYLDLLLELGNESVHQTTQSTRRITIPDPNLKVEFKDLVERWLDAVKDLQAYRSQVKAPMKKAEKKTVQEKKVAIEEARLSMDSYNRYTIFVRGTSSDTYGILKQAGITDAFKTLLKTTMPSPTIQDCYMQHMLPLQRLGVSGHTAWMSKYVVEKSEDIVEDNAEAIGDAEDVGQEDVDDDMEGSEKKKTRMT